MRRYLAAAVCAALAAQALSGCHSHWRRQPKDEADPAGTWGAALEPGERARLIETDALIRGELDAASAPGGAPAQRLERDARALGLSGADELAAVLDRGCLEPSDVARFAAARGVTPGTAGRYLAARFDASTCGAGAR